MDSAQERAAWPFLLLTRVFLGASMALLVTAFALYVRYQGELPLLTGRVVLWALGLALLPYAVALWWLLTLDERKGVALALSWASLALGMSLLTLGELRFRFVEKEIGVLGVATGVCFPAMQAALVVAAARAHRRLPLREGEKLRLVGGFLRALGFLLLLAAVAGFAMPSMHAGAYDRQRRAVRALWRIHDCAAEYTATHSAQGFPGSLSALGPGGSNCLGAKLASGAKDSYTFAYAPGAPDASGQVRTYTVVARPEVRFQPLRFLLDESGTVRYTDEERDPTAADPVWRRR